jgi:hypothetical protein
MVETEARRSPRIRNRNAGFKHNSCASRTCLACSALPPNLSKHLTKKVGEEFCKINPEKMKESEPSIKKRNKQRIGSKKTHKSGDKDLGPEDTEEPDQEAAKKTKQ